MQLASGSIAWYFKRSFHRTTWRPRITKPTNQGWWKLWQYAEISVGMWEESKYLSTVPKTAAPQWSAKRYNQCQARTDSSGRNSSSYSRGSAHRTSKQGQRNNYSKTCYFCCNIETRALRGKWFATCAWNEKKGECSVRKPNSNLFVYHGRLYFLTSITIANLNTIRCTYGRGRHRDNKHEFSSVWFR